MDIKLSVPRYTPVPNLTVETRPKQVREWLDALPLANSQESARKLTDAITTVNSVKLGDEARLKLMELYRVTARLLLPALHQQYVDKPLPLPEKHQQAAVLTRKLLTELGNGYKLVLIELLGRRISFGANKLVPLAIARAIECLGGILDVCYEIYGPTPAGVWSELHQLYGYAAQQSLHDTPIAEDEKTSVNAVYKQVLLIALADPYRLLQGQLVEVKAYVARFGQHAQLQPLGKAENTHGLFLVRLDGDKPPKALSHHSGVTDARVDIILNTVPLARVLHQQVQDLEANTPPAKLGLPDAAQQPNYREMLKRLIKQWGIAPKRVFNRTPTQNQTFICSGITTLHNALSQEEIPSVVEDEFDTHIILQMSDGMQSLGQSPTTGSYQTYNCASWQMLNESAGGVALAKEPGSYTKIKVGDIIGVGAAQAGSWGVAIVRWMQSNTESDLELGAQMLAPQAEAIAIKPVISAPDAMFQPALRLPEVAALKQPPRIVAPRGSFQSMREFEVRSQGMTTLVRATKLIEQTDTLDLFFFS